MYSWERRFGDVVKDTEKHLSKARKALDSSGPRNGYTSISDDTENFYRHFRSDEQSVLKPYSSGRLHESNDSSYGSYQMNSRSHDQSGGMVAILSEKIDRQGKVIEDLTRQVLTVERENEKGTLRLHSLEQEVTTLRHRMAEDGVHLQTEQKVDRFQWEMKAKLDEMKHQMEIQNRLEPSVNSGNDWRHAITSELHELKRQVEHQYDSIYREIEAIRSKLVRYDVDLTSQYGDTKELARQLDKLKQEFQVNSNKVSVQMNSLSSATAAEQRHNQWQETDPYSSSRQSEPVSSFISHLPGSSHRRKKHNTASDVSRKLPSHSSYSRPQHLSTSDLTSTSSDDLSSDNENTPPKSSISRGKNRRTDDAHKDTDDSLTLSDLELGDKSDTLDGSQHGFPPLSLDSDSLDLGI